MSDISTIRSRKPSAPSEGGACAANPFCLGLSCCTTRFSTSGKRQHPVERYPQQPWRLRLLSADAHLRGSYRKTLRVQEKQSTFQAANRGREAVHLNEIGAFRSSGARHLFG